MGMADPSALSGSLTPSKCCSISKTALCAGSRESTAGPMFPRCCQGVAESSPVCIVLMLNQWKGLQLQSPRPILPFLHHKGLSFLYSQGPCAESYFEEAQSSS